MEIIGIIKCIGICIKHLSITRQVIPVCFIGLLSMCPGFLSGRHKQRGRGMTKGERRRRREKRWAASEGVGFVIVA